jgi:hypothetical protein
LEIRIEQDDTSEREPFGQYTYRIYVGDRLVARFWHDYRGDDHGGLNCWLALNTTGHSDG